MSGRCFQEGGSSQAAYGGMELGLRPALQVFLGQGLDLGSGGFSPRGPRRQLRDGWSPWLRLGGEDALAGEAVDHRDVLLASF